ncbi:hypothetical protein N6H14_04005 [Paenibacillus sp. CC-CFT747]|nr:hypothetical protein N6H14_04005 [Paenibacillus sp. CC-CFT747]
MVQTIAPVLSSSFFIVTTILFIVFFQVFNEQNRKEALKANEFLGSQVMQYLDNSMRSIDFKVLREMLTNPSLKNYFANSPLDDVTAAIQAVGVMDELKLESPLIHSIYLVRDRDNTVLSNGKRIPLEDFPDAAFIKASRDHHVQRWEGARDFKAFPSQTPVRVMTLVRGESTGEDGLVVVNVDLPTVEKTILQMYDPNFTFVHVLNRAGEALWEPENPGKAGSAKLSKGEVFSEFTSSYGGWKVQTGLANGKVVKFALEFYTVWFAFAIVVVLIGVAWVIYVTRRNYKPIQQIVTLIQTVASQKKPGPERLQENEFRFIQTTLESMIDQTRQYRQTYEENLILQKKYFFQELLEGTKAYDKEEFRAEMDKFHLPFLDSLDNRWTAAVVEMDRYRQFTEDYHEQDQSLLKFVLSTVLQETAQHAGTEVWAEWLSDRRLTAMLWVKENRPPGLFEQKLLSTYREWVEQNLGFTVTIGVGKQAEDLTGLRESLKEANHALAYKAALGCNRILPRSGCRTRTGMCTAFSKPSPGSFRPCGYPRTSGRSILITCSSK